MITEIDIFLEHLSVEKNRSTATIDSYSRDLQRMLCFLSGEEDPDAAERYELGVTVTDGDVEIASIQTSDLTGFIEYSYDSGLAMKSISRRIACMKSFFRFLFNRDIIASNPAARLIFPKTGKAGRPLPLSRPDGRAPQLRGRFLHRHPRQGAARNTVFHRRARL
jgi:site-specific recombinase XerD